MHKKHVFGKCFRKKVTACRLDEALFSSSSTLLYYQIIKYLLGVTLALDDDAHIDSNKVIH